MLFLRMKARVAFRAFGSSSVDIGVFGVVGLHRVDDWARLASLAIERCDQLRRRLRGASSSQGGGLAAPHKLRLLDQISNEGC